MSTLIVLFVGLVLFFGLAHLMKGEDPRMTQDEYYKNIDEAIARAGKIMDLEDLDPENEEEYETQWEARFHCGVCTVRSVLDEVWPSIEKYITALEEGKVNVSSR